MEDRCVSLHEDYPPGQTDRPHYYRCGRSPGHPRSHTGWRIDLLGKDVEKSDILSWSDKQSTNPPQAPDLPEHPQDPYQMSFDLETQR